MQRWQQRTLLVADADTAPTRTRRGGWGCVQAAMRRALATQSATVSLGAAARRHATIAATA